MQDLVVLQMLTDNKEGFLSKERLTKYETLRNKPSAGALSNVSAYFHFGQLAPQRAALEAAKHRSTAKARCTPQTVKVDVLDPVGSKVTCGAVIDASTATASALQILNSSMFH